LRQTNTSTKDEVQHDTTKEQDDDVQAVVDLAWEMKKELPRQLLIDRQILEVFK
jgi:hypothetical protein